MVLRPATPADAEAIAATLVEAFEAYREFAQPGWEPPDRDREREQVDAALARADRWCAVAELEGEMAGHAAFVPAAEARDPTDEPGLAHLGELFVRPRWWGSGVATRLLAAAVDEASARGFERMRLFTPAAQARARRFYEREGWRPAGEAFEHEVLGLTAMEYRRDLRVPAR